MSQVKLAIVYYSMTGTNYKMAQIAKKAAEAAGAEVRVRRVQELAPEEVIQGVEPWKKHVEETQHVAVAQPEDLDWADAILFSMPTRFGNVPSQIKQFVDIMGPLWAQGKLANKCVSAMTSAQNPHGGQEQTILQLYTSMYHWGAIVVAPGYTDQALFAAGGNPYGTSVTTREDGTITPEEQEAIRVQTRRLLQVAQWLKTGQQASQPVGTAR
ncbi:MAG: NAD(P)H:quinone oxidoreductase [Thermoflavifilum sp.]|nr:NAD(P)H:quinone oxidoreductase [Thermoflavifilum sp.]MCL6514394.1 NAD(P)H:quinone oxidoreductase [Alicyclobacillus sp.]